MSIAMSCACGARFQVPDELAGRKGRCKKCGTVMRVPTAGARPAVTPPAAPPPPPPPPAMPSPASVQEQEDDIYGLAGDVAPARTVAAPTMVAPPPPPPPRTAPQSSIAAAAAARGISTTSVKAGAWRDSGNPPKLFTILKGVGGGILLVAGLLLAGAAVYMMTHPEVGHVRRPVKMIIGGLAMAVTGAGILAQSMGIGGMFDEE